VSLEAIRPQVEAQKPRLLDQLDSRAEVLIRSLPLDQIEPDPDQPRIHFDAQELAALAESLKREGLLQEPAVYPVASDGIRPTRFRLLFGERRWRAARLAGWTEIVCKVVPSVSDGDLVARLRQIDQQEKENSARAALSAVEEAKGLRHKLEVLRQVSPDAQKTVLVEQIATERGMDASGVFRLLDLLEAPECLRTAILERRITSRELAFQLSAHWTAVLREHGGSARREQRFREAVSTWAQAEGRVLSPETIAAYAGTHFLDPKMVRATIRAAEKLSATAESEFTKLVDRAIREVWTVKDARRRLSRRRGPGETAGAARVLFERTPPNKGNKRLIVHLDRLNDPETATTEARAKLAMVLMEIIALLESGPSATGREAEA
jgi:ParB family chromosome partitioning protein